MKRIPLLCAFSLLLLTAQAMAVNAPDLESETPSDVDFSLLPSESEQLRYLDQRHRDLIEQAVRHCEGKGPETAPAQNPCVIRRIRRLLDETGDPQLEAFHHALPDESRYNQIRTDMDWQPAVKSRIAETKPLPWGPPEPEQPR